MHTWEKLGVHYPHIDNSLTVALLVFLLWSCFFVFSSSMTHTSLPRGPRSHMTQVHMQCEDCSWEYKLMEPDAGLDCVDIEQKFWAMALILALLKIKWDFFKEEQKEMGPWKSKGFIP